MIFYFWGWSFFFLLQVCNMWTPQFPHKTKPTNQCTDWNLLRSSNNIIFWSDYTGAILKYHHHDLNEWKSENMNKKTVFPFELRTFYTSFSNYTINSRYKKVNESWSYSNAAVDTASSALRTNTNHRYIQLLHYFFFFLFNIKCKKEYIFHSLFFLQYLIKSKMNYLIWVYLLRHSTRY